MYRAERVAVEEETLRSGQEVQAYLRDLCADFALDQLTHLYDPHALAPLSVGLLAVGSVGVGARVARLRATWRL